MKIFVVGAGAVGGYFGGRLAAAGESVTFLCRGQTRAAIEKNGLRIESVSGDAHVHPATIEKAEGSIQADLVLWAVKTYSNKQAIHAANLLVGKGTHILSLQNGVDAVDELAESFGPERIIGGFASIAAEAVEPGVIRHTALGRITIGELDGGESDRVKSIAAILGKAQIPHKITTTIRRDLWAKLVWNAAFNPLSVLLHSTVEELLKNLASLSILKRAMEESMAVAKAEGHELSPTLIERYLDPKDQSGEFRTSMLQDFIRKRPMEIDAITGAVVRRARRHGVATPVNDLFFDALRYLEKEIA